MQSSSFLLSALNNDPIFKKLNFQLELSQQRPK